MGKAVSQASHSISKTDRKHVDSLLKVLRPKVYITDASSFKKLVQELTGNGNTNTNTPAAFTPPKQEQVYHHHVEAELSFDSGESSKHMLPSFDMFTGFESSWASVNNSHDSSVELSFDSSESSDQVLSSLDAFTGLENSWTSVNSQAMPSEEFIPWETEFDPFAVFSDYSFPSINPIYDDYSYHNQQELCVSDYDYTGLFNSL